MSNIPAREMDVYAGQIWASLRKVMGDFSHTMAKTVAESDLTYPQGLILLELEDRDKATMGEVSGALKMSPSVVSRLVDQLVEKKMVDRKRNIDDRRVVTVSLSREGKRAAENLYIYYKELMMTILSTLQKEEITNFISFLKELDQRLS